MTFCNRNRFRSSIVRKGGRETSRLLWEKSTGTAEETQRTPTESEMFPGPLFSYLINETLFNNRDSFMVELT